MWSPFRGSLVEENVVGTVTAAAFQCPSVAFCGCVVSSHTARPCVHRNLKGPEAQTSTVLTYGTEYVCRFLRMRTGSNVEKTRPNQEQFTRARISLAVYCTAVSALCILEVRAEHILYTDGGPTSNTANAPRGVPR